MVPRYTKDHLCSIIPQPIRREGYDATQMILGILGHHGASRFPFSPPVPVPGINGIAPAFTGTKSLVPDIPTVPGLFRLYHNDVTDIISLKENAR